MDTLNDYDFELPEALIAQAPLADRASSRLLHLASDGIHHRQFQDCIDILERGDVLVMNDTRVTARRLEGRRIPSGGSVEVLNLIERGPALHVCLAKPAKRLKQGARVEFDGDLLGEIVEELENGLRLIQFSKPIPSSAGRIPLPPYIHQVLLEEDRYQTVYASTGGSAAAPTAGLHFTNEILEALSKKGILITQVTLDVSLDTFRPVQVDNLDEHVMHGERCALSQATAELLNSAHGRIIAVGTTSTRTLESFAERNRKVSPGETVSRLFIRPGYEWQIVDGMFTNFHLPKTTMLLMLSALAGKDRIFLAYKEAIERGYRFLSFGDSMLIL